MSVALKAYFLREEYQVIARYYSKWRFALADLTLSLLYLFCNPYRYCRKFLQSQGARDIYAYGETPLTTLQTITREAAIASNDSWLELGSGRGRASLWIAHFVGCQTIGIEWISRFVKRGNWIAKFFQLRHLSFRCQSVLEAPFHEATVVYLYGTSWSDELIEELQMQMQKLPLGAKIISISFPISTFPLTKTFPVSFPWGDTEAYLHIKGPV